MSDLADKLLNDLIHLLGDMSDRTSRHQYDIGDYWNICDVAAENIEELRTELAKKDERIKELEEREMLTYQLGFSDGKEAVLRGKNNA